MVSELVALIQWQDVLQVATVLVFAYWVVDTWPNELLMLATLRRLPMKKLPTPGWLEVRRLFYRQSMVIHGQFSEMHAHGLCSPLVQFVVLRRPDLKQIILLTPKNTETPIERGGCQL